VWLRVQRLRHAASLQGHHGFLVSVEDAQVRVGASELAREQDPDILRLGGGKTSFSRAELQQDKLVVFAALQLKRPPVGAIWNDRVPDIRQR
jgi:hypothetical protein